MENKVDIKIMSPYEMTKEQLLRRYFSCNDHLLQSGNDLREALDALRELMESVLYEYPEIGGIPHIGILFHGAYEVLNKHGIRLDGDEDG